MIRKPYVWIVVLTALALHGCNSNSSADKDGNGQGVKKISPSEAHDDAGAPPLQFAEVRKGEDGYAWWLFDIVLRPRDTQAGGVGLADLNQWRATHMSSSDAVPYCFVQSVSRATYFSKDSSTRREISQTFNELGGDPFHYTFEPTPGVRLTSRVAAFQTCTGKTGTFITTQDESGRLIDLDESPEPFRFLSPAVEGNSIIAFGCLACDNASRLVYSRQSGTVRWEYAGP